MRFGQLHRNTFIFSPGLLDSTMQFKSRVDLFFAGQITGIEGYAGNIASGLLAGINAERSINGKSLLSFPETTMIGALCHYITHAAHSDYQPMKANFGILPTLDGKRKLNKRQRSAAYSGRAIEDLRQFMSEQKVTQGVSSKPR